MYFYGSQQLAIETTTICYKNVEAFVISLFEQFENNVTENNSTTCKFPWNV